MRAPALLLTLLLPTVVLADELLVSAPMSLKEVLDELAPPFAKAAGIEIRMNLGASGELARQLELGAPADVFVSAAARHVDELAAKGALERASAVVFAANSLVLVQRAESGRPAGPARELLTAPSTRRIAVGDPRLVPAGACAEDALKRLDLLALLRPRLLPAAHVRAALDLVARGEADLGLVYRTDVATRAALRVAADLPGAEGCARYAAAVVSGSRNAASARAFVAMLAGPAARAVLLRRGFLAP
jgi:molybdate transport system substrate-binding protein